MSGVVATGLLRRNAFFDPEGGDTAPDVICLGPPFTVSEQELDLMAEALEASITEAAR